MLEGKVQVSGFAHGTSRPEWVRQVKANEQIEYRPIGLVANPASGRVALYNATVMARTGRRPG